MIEARRYNRSLGGVSSQPARDFNFALGFAVLTLLLHSYTQVVELTRISELSTLTSQTIPWVFIVIEIGLLINVIGLWLRRAGGIWLSIAALSSVGVVYVVWYVYSRQILKLLLAQPFYRLHAEAVPPHTFGLISATWMNIVVIVMSGVLFVWEAKTLRSMKRAEL